MGGRRSGSGRRVRGRGDGHPPGRRAPADGGVDGSVGVGPARARTARGRGGPGPGFALGRAAGSRCGARSGTRGPDPCLSHGPARIGHRAGRCRRRRALRRRARRPPRCAGCRPGLERSLYGGRGRGVGPQRAGERRRSRAHPLAAAGRRRRPGRRRPPALRRRPGLRPRRGHRRAHARAALRPRRARHPRDRPRCAPRRRRAGNHCPRGRVDPHARPDPGCALGNPGAGRL